MQSAKKPQGKIIVQNKQTKKNPAKHSFRKAHAWVVLINLSPVVYIISVIIKMAETCTLIYTHILQTPASKLVPDRSLVLIIVFIDGTD